MENRIKEMRESINLSQRALAEGIVHIAGVGESAIGNYENQTRKPDLSICRAITAFFVSRGLNVTLDDVFPPEEFKNTA